jgi:diguanylate cyclase (GGDEF)-like protein
LNASIQALGKIFHSQESVSEQQLARLFDDIGVPDDMCWRAVFQMIFDPGTTGHSGAGQNDNRHKLELVMRQALDIAGRAAFSRQALLDLMKACNTAFVSVCHKELSDALNDLDEFAKEFKSICLTRQDNIKTLEKETLETVASDLGIRDKIRQVKIRFRHTIEQFQADAVKLDHMNNTDHLTGLYNRRFFDRQLALELDQAMKEKTWLHLLMVDIDNFKRFNDTYGHQIGDQALKTVAKHIQTACQAEAEKIGIYFFPTRYGGEEFAVILPAVEPGLAVTIAEGIRKKIYQYTFVIRTCDGTIKHKGLNLSVSIGGAALDHNGTADVATRRENLMKQADAAMYAAKKAGKNQVKIG